MMFKKGSFEIGATVYPVAIKVRVNLFCFVRYYFDVIILMMINSGSIDPCSMIPDLEMPSGIAASLAWSTICYE